MRPKRCWAAWRVVSKADAITVHESPASRAAFTASRNSCSAAAIP